MISEREIKDPSDRLKAVQALYGDRCAMMDLDKFLKQKKLQFPETVQLVMLKTKDVDDLGTHLAQDTARFIPAVLKKLPAAISKLRELGFGHVVLATDHGFILLEEQEAGDVGTKACGRLVAGKGPLPSGQRLRRPGHGCF